MLRSPESLLTSRTHELWTLRSRGRDLVGRQMDAADRQATHLRASLRALSPGATLDRGYAIAHVGDGVIVRDAAQAPAGTAVVVTVAQGSFAARSEGEVPEAPASRDTTRGDSRMDS